MRSFPAEREHEAHVLSMACRGFTIVHNAIPADLLTPIRRRFDELIDSAANVPTAVCNETTGVIDLNRMYELDPVFESLMDLSTVFPIVQEVMANDVTLLGGSIGHYVPPRTTAGMRWHVDGDYVRLTYILDDIGEDGGGTVLVPGTHLIDAALPDWCNDENDGPCEIPGMIHLVAPAGSCMVNHTMLWHTRGPNTSDRARRLIWQVYKRAEEPVTKSDELRLSQAYIECQTDPRRRALVGLSDT